MADLRATIFGRWMIMAGLCRIAVSFAVLLSACANATAEPKRILLLHSFGRDFAPFNEIADLLREQLVKQSPQPVDIYEASLQTARFSDVHNDKSLVEYLLDMFSRGAPDLVVTTGGPAARFAQHYRQELFPSTPMLITAVEQRNIDKATLHSRDRVVAFALDHAAVMNNILQVLPKTTELVVIHGNSPFEKIRAAVTYQGFQPFADKVKTVWLNELALDDILNRVSALPPQSAIYFGLFAVDAAGISYAGNRALKEIHARANAPIFTFIDTHFGQGVVGGPLLSHKALVQESVQAATGILAGEASDGVKAVILGMGAPIYDWRELRRWSIDQSRLPAGSTIAFRELTMWERYRWQLTAIAVAVLTQAAIIAWLLAERHRRTRAELESRGRLLEVIHLNRTAAAGALSASIAHELNQPLGAIRSYADAAERYLTADPPRLERALTILGNIRRDDQRAADIITRLRTLLKKRPEIVPQQFDLNDVIEETRKILEAESLKRGVPILVSRAATELPVCADQVHLQQVLLNLAMNGFDAMEGRDPAAAALAISAAIVGDEGVEISVSDTGDGIPEHDLSTIFEKFYTTKQHGTGLGLSIARTIVETYGGKIWAENRPGGGAIFRFTLPLVRQVTS